MRSVTLVVLTTLIAQVSAEQDSVHLSDSEGFLDKLVDKLISRVNTQPNDLADLDDMTLAKTPATAISRIPVRAAPLNAMPTGSIASQVSSIQETLKAHGMAPSPMQKLALTAMATANQGCSATRDVSANAQMRQVFQASDSVTQGEALELTQSIKVNAKEMAGVTPPFGFWDPLGFSAVFKDGSSLLYFREAEIKHGRVCMLAFLGMIVGEKFHPFFGGNIDMPSYQVRQMFLQTDFNKFWLAGFALFGGLEALSVRTQYDEQFDDAESEQSFTYKITKKDRIPGDLGFDPLRLKPKKPDELKEIQTKEILNGRLAMIAVTGILAQELATGQKVF